jgi:hypothetical protein
VDAHRVTLHAYPSILQATLYSLKPKVGGSNPLPHKLVVKRGAIELAKIPDVKELRTKRASMVATPSFLAIATAFAARRYPLRNPSSCS